MIVSRALLPVSEVGDRRRKKSANTYVSASGEVVSILKGRVASFERKPGKAAGELEILARNEAERVFYQQ
jgi:hypothetical protein